MKFDPPLAKGRLVRRYKRFLADITLPDGQELTIHCPNTGAMTACSDPGANIWFSTSANPQRKYPHTFELIEVMGGALAGVNTARANPLVSEALEAGVITELQGYERLRRECRYGRENSRIDFLLEAHPQLPDCYVEVKSVTLGAGEGLGLFPDAVTTRGTRHLRELIEVVEAGYRGVLLFCVQHSAIERVSAAQAIDPLYADTLRLAQRAGVEVIAYGATLSPQEIRLVRPVPVVLNEQP